MSLANANNSYWQYGYDSLGQVTSGSRKWSDDTAITGQQYAYEFDDIGNRKTSTLNSRLSTYTANTLNQYTQRTVPGVVDILGTAASNATVTINNQRTSRHGEYFSKETAVDNTGSTVYTQLVTLGVLKNAGSNQTDIVTSSTGKVFVAQSPEQFTYDADGNLTSDGRWNYTWDAENQLTMIESLTNAPAASKRKVEWMYDYQGRRIRQTTYNGSSGSYVTTGDLKFIFDGLQCVAELNATNNAVARSYVWGLDLSSSTTGAGGVGGLLMMNSAANGMHFYAMDGNGNVAALVSATSGDISATYEYSLFGETIRATGAMASENSYQFSTKRKDNITGLILYEYRVYRSDLGCWLSRDPLEEEGGINLFGFVFNNPSLFIDTDGAQPQVNFGPRRPDVPPQPRPYMRGNGNPLTALRALWGIPWSILSGDIFDKKGIVENLQFGTDKCSVTITINGIWNDDDSARNLLRSVRNAPRFQSGTAVRVQNGTHFWFGDLMQILGNELGAIDVTADRAATQINIAYAALKKNGCACGVIKILAHSQGGMVLNRALPMVDPRAKSLLCITTIKEATLAGQMPTGNLTVKTTSRYSRPAAKAGQLSLTLRTLQHTGHPHPVLSSSTSRPVNSIICLRQSYRNELETRLFHLCAYTTYASVHRQSRVGWNLTRETKESTRDKRQCPEGNTKL